MPKGFRYNMERYNIQHSNIIFKTISPLNAGIGLSKSAQCSQIKARISKVNIQSPDETLSMMNSTKFHFSPKYAGY